MSEGGSASAYSDDEDASEPIVGGGDEYDDYGEADFDTVDNDSADEDDGDDRSNQASGAPVRPSASSHAVDPIAANYIRSLGSASGLYLAERGNIEKAYRCNGEAGLFSLFITKEFKRRIQKWTNEGLKQRGQRETTDNEFDAYIGLELAMSVCPLNNIGEFWCEKTFIGQRDFASTMSRNRFQSIRSRVKFHPLDATAGNGADPLWHSRILMEHMQTKFVEMATPFGTSSLDENSVRTKARTRAKSFIPSKPDKYAIRFYAVVAWSSLYIHSIWDNGSGNLSKIAPCDRYTKVFPGLATPLARTFANPDSTVAAKSASALWIAMMGHQAASMPSPTGHRLLITDNFYTRHALAKTLFLFTDGETRMLGTMRETNVDKQTKAIVSASMERVEASPRGTWELIGILEREPGYIQRKRDHSKAQRSVSKNRRTIFPDPLMVFAEHAGYIVFKDKKVVLFYTNDLRNTPAELVMKQDDHRAIECVHGLYPVKRWTGQENLHRKVFMVPAIIAAYNKGMNGVDRVDQLRATNPTRRKEMRLSMSLFTWALDLCIINAFALLREIQPASARSVTLREFKRRIAEELTKKQTAITKQTREKKRGREASTVAGIVGGISSEHILTPNSTAYSDGWLKCMLCSIRGRQNRARWGCVACQRGFHVECFAAYHFQDVFKSSSTPSVRTALDLVCATATGNQAFKTRTRKNNTITPITMLSLPE